MNEVEDAVTARIHARREVRPGHRTLGRNRRAQFGKRAFLHQSLEVGQAPFGHEFLQQIGIHAVDAEHDDIGCLLRGDGRGEKEDEEGEPGTRHHRTRRLLPIM
jgi:hypothetical protein